MMLAGQAVVLGELGIDDEVGIDEVIGIEVFLNEIFEEFDGFACGGVADAAVVGEVVLPVDGDAVEAVELDPLAHEALEKRIGFGVGQHAGDLFAQFPGFQKFAGLRQRVELFIRRRAPEEGLERGAVDAGADGDASGHGSGGLSLSSTSEGKPITGLKRPRNAYQMLFGTGGRSREELERMIA